MRIPAILVSVLVATAACGTSDTEAADAASSLECALGALSIGLGAGASFHALRDGDEAEIVLGFQGLRMLELSARVEGASDDAVDIVSYLEVDGSDISVSQRNRDEPLATQADGASLVEGYLLFLHDAPPEALVGHDARLDLIVREGSCSATHSVQLVLRDDDACVDFDVVVPDAGAADPSVTDGAVACE